MHEKRFTFFFTTNKCSTRIIYDDEKYMIIIMIIMEKNYHDTSEKYSMYSPFVFSGLFKSTSMLVQYHIFILLHSIYECVLGDSDNNIEATRY